MGHSTDERPQVCVAAKSGDADAVKTALAGDPKAALAVDPLYGGRTALSAAAAAGHTDIVKALIDAGAVDTVVRGWSAACHAAYGGHTDVLAALAAGIGVGAMATPTGTSMPPLLLACLKGHRACASLILDAEPAALGARDPHGRTALMLAASAGNVELIELLVERGAPIDDASSEGKTALMWAIGAHRPLAVQALARLGANPDLKTLPNPDAPITPGKDRTVGESILELSDHKHTRDPTFRLLHKYLSDWVEQRAQRPEDAAPPFDPLPWISHAEAFVAAEAAKAAAAPEEATEEPAAPAGSEAESDIFDAVDVTDEQPVGGDQREEEAKAVEAEAKKTAMELAAADGDLDDLD